jgi:cell division protein FtsI (penicillin-binding protein 3)
MGYELAVTPLQLAAAYGAIANGGTLLEPALVREVRDAEGSVVFKHAARAVRRVMPPDVAATMREMLRTVVDSGTATGADLASYTLGGKSGTVRRTEPGRGYAAGKYNAVFAGIFPIEDPQFVIIVKLDNPAGVYYGGKTAAPVSKVVLQAALAARDAALDRASLAARVRVKSLDSFRPKDTLPGVGSDSELAARAPAPAVPVELQREIVAVPTDSATSAPPTRVVVDLPAPRATAAILPSRPVPTVQGLPVRDAVFALHRAGFRVRVADQTRGGASSAGRTQPSAGSIARAGAIVTLYREP